MNIKKLIIIIIISITVVSCASKGTTNKNNNSTRTENTDQVRSDSAEMVNVDLGVGYLKRGKDGDLEIALEKFKKAIAFNPKFGLAHSMIANVYDRKGLFDSAKKHYDLSIKYSNGSPDVINNYANFLCQRGSYERAIRYYMDVVNNPQYNTPASAYENAGVCATKAKNMTQAEGFFRKALDANDKQPNALYNLMLIHLDKQQYLKALAFLQRLEQVVQPSSEMLAAGYKIEKGLKHDTLANKYLTKLKKNFPGSKPLRTINE